MKPIISIVAAVTAMAAALAALTVRGGAKEQTPEALRLHILANSDSEEDQRIKLLVRDALLETFSESYDASSLEDAKRALLELGPELQSTAEQVLLQSGKDYGVTLEAGQFDFPDREYSGKVYPAGRYSALRVILGSGEGHNWWCVMFPPLCVIDDGSGVKYNEDGTLEFRSLIADIWRELFG